MANSSRGDAGQRLGGRIAIAAVLVLLPSLAACSSSSGPETVSLPPAPAPPAAAAKATPAAPQPVAGFTPLPTPQQVVAALPTGRVDPFAALTLPSGSAAAAPAQALRLTGVIRTAGQAQALVQLGDQSGAVCVGRRGECRGSGLPAWLPADWSVTSIDVASGRMVLNQAGQRRVFQL